MLLIPAFRSKAQCADPTNIRYPFDWSVALDNEDRDDIAWDVAPIDTNGDGFANDGVVIAGSTGTALSQRQAFIIRLRNNGSLVWSSIQGGGLNDVAYGVAQAPDNNILVVGTKRSNTIGGVNSDNVWLFKLNLSNGTLISGSEKEYGGTGQEDGFDVVVDPSTDPDSYIIAGGTGKHKNYDLADNSINAGGDYWVLSIKATDHSIWWDSTYHGTQTCGADTIFDWAHSIIMDHNGKYLVSGFCSSCESDKVHQQVMLVKLEKNGTPIWSNDYGYKPATNSKDQGSWDLLEGNDGSYTYFSAGVDHKTGCIGSQHNFYGLETNPAGTDTWTPNCSLDDGIAYGGTKKEDAFGAATACGGYIMVGRTTSNNDNDVSCNHDPTSPYAYDVWILKVDASGAIEWDESIGDTLNDEAHIIRRMPGGAYVMAGEFGSGPAELQNFYVVQFQILECTAISGPSLQASVQNCSTVAFSWDAVACAAYYELAYRIDGGSWVAVTTTSPQKPVTGLSPGSKYSWRVRSICSPNVQSSFVTGADVTLTSCKTGYDNSSADIFSVHPNPAEGLLEFLLVLHEKLDGISSISVIDLFGKAVFLSEAKMESGVLKKQLWLGHFPSGFYWLNIELNGEVYRIKLILQ